MDNVTLSVRLENGSEVTITGPELPVTCIMFRLFGQMYRVGQILYFADNHDDWFYPVALRVDDDDYLFPSPSNEDFEK